MRGRFAPSPTGEMHIGNARTALLTWLQVRKAGGTLVLRMEDIDTGRSRPHLADQILQDLRWLGLDWDEGPDVGGPVGPYTQSRRLDWYREVIGRLQSGGWLFRCYCSRAELARIASAPHGLGGETAYPGTCRNLTPAAEEARRSPDRQPALRFRVPAGTVSFHDLIAGAVSHDPQSAPGDFVVRRSDGLFAYQLAVVADDAAMGITHVLRGDDLLDSTPRQILLYRALGSAPPAWAHVPLVADPGGTRLSKRAGALAIAWLRAHGARPESVIGYLAHLSGLAPAGLSLRPQDLLDTFDLSLVPCKPPRLNPEMVLALIR